MHNFFLLLDQKYLTKNKYAKVTSQTATFACVTQAKYSIVKGNTKFWYGVMNLVQMNILEAYAILQYLVIVVAVEIESEVMKLLIIHSLFCIAPSQGQDIN